MLPLAPQWHLGQGGEENTSGVPSGRQQGAGEDGACATGAGTATPATQLPLPPCSYANSSVLLEGKAVELVPAPVILGSKVNLVARPKDHWQVCCPRPVALRCTCAALCLAASRLAALALCLARGKQLLPGPCKLQADDLDGWRDPGRVQRQRPV